MGKYFGTDGFRGEANENLTADHAYKVVGRFLGWYYGELKRRNGDDTPARIIIEKDTRQPSYMFEYTLVGGLYFRVRMVIFHVTTTPSVAGVRWRTDCGIMIPQAIIHILTNEIQADQRKRGEDGRGDHFTCGGLSGWQSGSLRAEMGVEIPFAKKEKSVVQ